MGIGVVADLDGEILEDELHERYNAPDMRYFSEDDTIAIDLFTPALEEAYLFYNRVYNIDAISDEDFTTWEEQTKALYLRICKRLMHFDFSGSFTKADGFLVVARDFEACNEEEYHNEMQTYKQEMSI